MAVRFKWIPQGWKDLDNDNGSNWQVIEKEKKKVPKTKTRQSQFGSSVQKNLSKSNYGESVWENLTSSDQEVCT